MGRAFLPVHASWSDVLDPLAPQIEKILQSISNDDIAPGIDRIFAACEMDLSSVKCVIVGQDPYPTPGNAHGLAFSVSPEVKPLPASLRNIFAELISDVGVAIPENGDLSPWRGQGVLLLNRVLTTKVGQSNAHAHIGWQEITSQIAQAAASQGAIGVLWGKSAQELSHLFTHSIESVHPSPLSAYRGFFGSKPFSKVNQQLERGGVPLIDWSL
ncbi:MAG: uracil-DNA glycosylase [Candidatus Planktophila sp.]|nr:uracil-DNA glycosylase [Candidatus Planktophila sp.]